MSLRIIRCKPNPIGRDIFANNIPDEQLVGEWFDIKNITSDIIFMNNIQIYHKAYLQNDSQTQWGFLIHINGELGPGEVARIHAGSKEALKAMKPIDQIGATHHFSTGLNYKLNNTRDEEILIWDKLSKTRVDSAKYKAYPSEGKILIRVNEYLI